MGDLRVPNAGIVIEQFSKTDSVNETYSSDYERPTNHASSGVRLPTTLHTTDKGREWSICILHNPEIRLCIPCSGIFSKQCVLRR